jgi:hypothetical protein
LELEENRKQNKTNNINFTKLKEMYKPQVNRLKDKKYEEDPSSAYEPEDFTNYKTYGNLFPFRFPVRKTIPSELSLRDVERAVEEQSKEESKGGSS